MTDGSPRIAQKEAVLRDLDVADRPEMAANRRNLAAGLPDDGKPLWLVCLGFPDWLAISGLVRARSDNLWRMTKFMILDRRTRLELRGIDPARVFLDPSCETSIFAGDLHRMLGK
jgi:hypothetical protein